MIYMRGQSGDYDRWAELTGDPSWAWDKVLPLFMKTEDHHGGASAAHGSGGEWRVEKQRLSWQILDAFRDAADQVGIRKVDDFNGGDNAGCALFRGQPEARHPLEHRQGLPQAGRRARQT